MMYLLLIAMFMILFLRDMIPRPLVSELWTGTVSAGWVAAVSLGLMAGVWIIAHARIWGLGRRLERTGDPRVLLRADRTATALRAVAVMVHGFNVLVLGWLDVVRRSVGNLIVVDELLAVLPVLVVFALGWWSMYPLERQLREATILHDASLGRPVRTMPGRWAFVLGGLRHQVALVLVPVTLIITWNELVERGTMRFAPPPALQWLPAVIQLAGMAMVLTMMPLVLRRVWDTVAMAPGPLRDQIVEMCREHRVRVRELLVWRTHGTMVNGAVMGIAWPFRYILLTDALLEQLHPRQVEAVTAHEVGHVRRRHMPWLLACALASILLSNVALLLALSWVAGSWLSGEVITTVAAVGALLVALVAFGFASRRFEWQADAFAAQHLSRQVRRSAVDEEAGNDAAREQQEQGTITPEAVNAMSSALDTVARLNHIRRDKFTWRHGSILSRQRRLEALAGRQAGRLKADRDAGLVKLAAAAGLIVAVGLIVADQMM